MVRFGRLWMIHSWGAFNTNSCWYSNNQPSNMGGSWHCCTHIISEQGTTNYLPNIRRTSANPGYRWCTNAQYVHTSNGYAGMPCIQTHPYEIKPLVKRLEPDMNRFLSNTLGMPVCPSMPHSSALFHGHSLLFHGKCQGYPYFSAFFFSLYFTQLRLATV